jgi:superfamily II DNA or RNA helicase
MPQVIVFNLYPAAETLYFPSANIVELDAGGEPAHLLQRATPATMAPYGLEPTPALQRLFALIDFLTPKAIEEKFKPARARQSASLAQLLQNDQSKPLVEAYCHRQLDAFLTELVGQGLPLTLDAERRTLAKDVLLRYAAPKAGAPAEDGVAPYLSFRKTTAGIDYRLRLGRDDRQWTVQERGVMPLTNTEPAWLVTADGELLRVPGINGNMVRPFLQKDVVRIPADKARVYFRTFIAKNAARTRIEAEGFAVQTTDQLTAARLVPFEHVLENAWLLQPHFEYEGATSFPAGETRQSVTTVEFREDSDEGIVVRQVRRQPALEAERLAALAALGLQADGKLWRIPAGLKADAGPDRAAATLESCLDWLARHSPALEAAGFAVEAPRRDGRALALGTPEIALGSQAAGDWFDVYGEIRIGEHRFPFKALVPNLRRRDRFFVLPDDSLFLIPQAWFTRYAELADVLQDVEDGATLRLARPLFTLLGSIGLAGEVDGLPCIDPDTVEYTPSPNLRALLRPYQLRGVKWLVGHYRHGFGACLADDMGLGKTLQTIAALLYAKELQEPAGEAAGTQQLDLFAARQAELRPLRALIVLPASLVFNWQRELAQFAPSLFVYAHAGAKRLRDVRALAAHDVVLTTYHTLRQDLALLERIDWHYLVLDESQQIKNHRSEVSRTVRALPAQNKISLSGTPIENSLADLWTQMEFINPSTLGEFADFNEQFLTPIEKRGDAGAKERLFQRVRPFFMRRTKQEVAPDLPALTEQVFYSEMAPEQAKRYEQVKSAMRNEILGLFDDPKTRLQALQALMRLRQLANHPVLTEPGYRGSSGKFDDVLAQWDTLRRAGHKVLFFSSFEKHLELFRPLFEKSKQPYAWLTGATAAEDRAREVRRFQEEARVQAFFMTVKAGGVGLNLTAADYVFLLDPWWNPAVEDQAVARAHRIGQTRPVTAVRFISRQTIEEKIVQLQERKRTLGEGLFSATTETPRLSREELEGLLA